jgi:hypothetical protein
VGGRILQLDVISVVVRDINKTDDFSFGKHRNDQKSEVQLLRFQLDFVLHRNFIVGDAVHEVVEAERKVVQVFLGHGKLREKRERCRELQTEHELPVYFRRKNQDGHVPEQIGHKNRFVRNFNDHGLRSFNQRSLHLQNQIQILQQQPQKQCDFQ